MGSALLSHREQSFLAEVREYFGDLQLGMSAFQIRNFVLSDESFPLPDSKYHQAKLELYTRWQKITDLELSLRKSRAEAKLLQVRRLKWQANLVSELSHERLEAEAQIELLQIEEERLEISRVALQKSCAETLREMRVFCEVVQELETHLCYDSREAAEPEFWHQVQAIRELKPGVTPDQLPFKRFLRPKNGARLQGTRERLPLSEERRR